MKYTHNFDQYAPNIRGTAPAAQSHSLGSYQIVTVGPLRVMLFKSELHLNQDGKKVGPGLRPCRSRTSSCR